MKTTGEGKARLTAFTLALSLVVFIFLVPATPGLSSFIYRIVKQQDQLTIKENADVELVRYFEFEVSRSSTEACTEIWVGLPTPDTMVSSVIDEDGNAVRYSVEITEEQYIVKLRGFPAIKPGTSRSFTVTATVPKFIFPDTQNEDYVTMRYIPGWWSSEVGSLDIAVILPNGVEKSEIKTGSRKWDGIAQTQSGAYVVTWSFRGLRPDERVSVTVGFPEKYVTLPSQLEGGKTEPVHQYPEYRAPGIGEQGAGTVLVVLMVVAFMLFVVLGLSREQYSSPQVSMEGVGVNENLSPVEASILLNQPPEKTITLLLFSMIKRGIVRVYSTDPLKLAVEYERDLSEAEKLFIQAINRETGEIEPAKLVPVFRYLVISVNEKMKPYCRRDTEEFYRRRIAELWGEVKAQGTPEMKLEAVDRHLLWLLQAEESSAQLKQVFDESEQMHGYAPPRWWVTGFPVGPFGYFWPHYVFMGYYGISDRILRGEERRFREITESVFVPVRPAARAAGGHTGHHGGIFTPPSCACACACVSCACACACAGGGGCT
ncbi:MAG TPA: DUF2207 domain-containing protein [Firmicutes bacterium]|nr:DUF2207 domain-containing protein [Candidatus Fermentithermobacillaceae bacterium]